MKKGFVASIDLADPAHSVALADYVGRRVSVTGTLTGRDMKVKGSVAPHGADLRIRPRARRNTGNHG